MDEYDAIAANVAVSEVFKGLQPIRLELSAVEIVVEVGIGEVGAQKGVFLGAGEPDVVREQVAMGDGFDELDAGYDVKVKVAMPVVGLNGNVTTVDFGGLDALGVVLADHWAGAGDP